MSSHRSQAHFARVEALGREIDRFVPAGTRGADGFRADLAGLLVTTMASTFESCVKDILVDYAGRHHVAFERFSEKQYDRLNSRVNVSDLHRYTKLYGKTISDEFKEILKLRRIRIRARTGVDIEKHYGQVLSWRHDFAHAWVRNTTIEEALTVFNFSKRVIYSFEEAFQS